MPSCANVQATGSRDQPVGWLRETETIWIHSDKLGSFMYSFIQTLPLESETIAFKRLTRVRNVVLVAGLANIVQEARAGG